MLRIEHASVEATADNLWFLERYLNVFDFADLFPADALSSEGRRGVPVTLKTDLGFEIVSDIDGSKMQLRNRSKHRGWERWTREHGLRVGDRIILQRVGEREYTPSLERGNIE
ncbi:hypothetical protein KKH27_07445 [bacterium]|nr:hypothetical protein [bacterium]MBU1983182.1 hypothetical protein [bacterium]